MRELPIEDSGKTNGPSVALLVPCVWAVAAASLLALCRDRVLRLTPLDSDDYMRILQVRDWLAGQSWWDVSQHRMNPPGGGLLHWSRIPDLPIAGIEILLRPLAPGAAERIAAATVPLLLLLALMAVVAMVVRRLFDGTAPALAALLLVLASLGALVQFTPGRVDHHGWQILMAATGLLGLLDPRPRRSGMVAGAAFAVGLAISLEGAIVAAAAAAMLLLRWIVEPAERGRAVAFLTCWAGTQALLFAATTRPLRWESVWCDAIGPQHLAALAAAAGGTALLTRFGAGRGPAARVALLVPPALLAAGLYLGLAPQCRAGPFAHLDPLAYRLWYLNVDEGMPIWRQPVAAIPGLVWFSLVGVLGAARGWHAARDAEVKRRWLVVLALALASFAAALLVRRAIGSAQILAIPGGLGVILALRARALRLERPATRLLALAAAFLVPSPLGGIYMGAALAPSAADEQAAADPACDRRCELAPLATLPPGYVLAGLDLGPPLLAFTPHQVLAGPYHRNDRAIAETMRAFLLPDRVARATMERHAMRYLLVDPQSGEARLYMREGPRGLMAALAAGRTPAWLVAVPLPPGNRLRLYRRR